MIHRTLEGGADRSRHRRFIAALSAATSAVAVVMSLAGPVLAHGEERRIVVEPPIALPGDELSVHGEFLWTDTQVSVSIVGQAGDRRELGVSTTSGDGRLETRVRLPADLQAGHFHIVVSTSAGEAFEVDLVVEPSLPLVPAVGGGLAVLAGALLGRSALNRRRVSQGPA